MPLETFRIEHLRNISHSELCFSPGLNLITGANASGKTSLLEGIALLVQGRSFRTPRVDQLVQHNTLELNLFGSIRVGQVLHALGLTRKHKVTQVKLDGAMLNRSTDLIELQPLHVITPESHELLDQGPKIRRQFLDWGVFHVKPGYLDCWRRYHRILRQRNHVLRTGGSAQSVQAWDGPLLLEAQQLDAFRTAYVQTLSPYLARFGQQLLEMEIEFTYRKGWSRESGSLEVQLKSDLARDRDRGFTQSGPHRADISVRSGGVAVKEVLSRGQQKLLICAMYLAQVTQSPIPGILLIDDLPAELDPTRRSRLLEAAANTGAQVFVTATEASLIPTAGWQHEKVFHVEHGEFREVV
jgi:DNA replication and repair protein RecF